MMPAMRFRLAVLLTVSACLTTGCDTHADPKPAAVSRPLETAAPQGDPKEAFRDARLDVLEANTGFYRVSAVLGPLTLLTQGQYDLEREATTARYSIAQPDIGQIVVDAVVIGEGGGWMRFVSGMDMTKPSCWFSIAELARVGVEQDVPQAELLVGGVAGVPLPLEVILRGTVDHRDGNRLLGHSTLLGLSGSVSAKFPAALGLVDYDKTGRVTFELTDGRLTGWRTRMGDILQDAERAGLEVPKAMQVYQDYKDSMGGISVLLSQTGRDLTIEPPPRELIVTPVADDKEFERRLMSCPEE